MRAWFRFALILACAAPAWAQAFQPTPAIHTVFLITMENLRWSEVVGSPSAPFINNTLLPAASYATQYYAVPNLHPSEPNYLWLESGQNYGIEDDNLPPQNVQTAPHLVTALAAAGYSWGAWVENIDGSSCPLAVSADGLYTPAVNPTVFFADVTDNSNPGSYYCIAHEHPFSQLQSALQSSSVPNFNWVVPNLCDDAHSCPLSTGDQWLANVVPMIENSPAYRDGGAIFITWDEVDTPYANVPVGLIVLSPSAKGGGYSNSIYYTHASTLRTFEEIFGLSPLFANAATATDLADLFNTASLSVSPASLPFAPQPVGTVSPPQAVTILNGGGAPVALRGIAVTGAFQQANDCGASLASGASCTVNVTFAPAQQGRETGALTVSDSAPGSPQAVALSGQAEGGVASISPAALNFGNQAIGVTSKPLAVSLANTGVAPLALGSISAGPPFIATNNCGPSLAAGAQCTVQVAFTPSSPASSSALLTFSDNAANTPQTVSLAGQGSGALAVISSEDLHFGAQAVGSVSAPLAFTLTNSGNIALNLSKNLAGPFAETDNCGASLAAGKTCLFQVTFKPLTPGGANGAITLSDNAPDSPQEVEFDGSGQGAVAQLFPSSLTFAPQPDGSASPTQYLTLENGGNLPLAISRVTVTGPFTQTNNCNGQVADAASCYFNVAFDPAANGAATGTLSVYDNAAGSPQTVSLNGTGEGPVARLAPASLAFGLQPVGTSAPPQSVTLNNAGSEPLQVASVSATGPYTAAAACGALAPGASCTVAVTFTPTAVGNGPGALAIADNAPASPQTIALGGTGAGPLATLSPVAVSFGGVAVGASSAPRTITLTNPGNLPLALAGVSVTGPFAQSSSCATLAAGASCSIQLVFSPLSIGNAAGTLAIADSAPGSPQTVNLSGAGDAPLALAQPSALHFGMQNVNSPAASRALTIANTGNVALTLGPISASSPFTASSGCQPTLAPSASCTVAVGFAPSLPGPAIGSLALPNNGLNSPQSVPLDGVGMGPVASAQPLALTFAPQVEGAVGSPQAVTVSNTGNTGLVVTAVAAGGPFQASTNCAQLLPGAACAVMASFAPTALGEATGELAISTNAPGSQLLVALRGVGLGPVASVQPASLAFAPQLSGTASAPQSVTIANTGTAPLQLAQTIAGNDFGVLDTCRAPVPPQASCTVAITFQPLAAGTHAGALRLAGNAGVQTVALSGVATDLQLSAAGPAPVLARGGGHAALQVVLTPVNGFTDPHVQLACTQSPPGSACVVSPQDVAVGPAQSPAVTVMVVTGAAAPPWSPIAACLLALLLLAPPLAALARRRATSLVWLLAVVLLASACGSDPPAGPAPGDYSLTVAARTSAGAVRSLALPLAVR